LGLLRLGSSGTFGLSSQLKEVQEKGEAIIRLDVLTREYKLSGGQRVVLELALGQAEFQIQDLEAKCPGVQRRSLQRDLRSLIEKGVLVAAGATNWLVYRAAANL